MTFSLSGGEDAEKKPHRYGHHEPEDHRPGGHRSREGCGRLDQKGDQEPDDDTQDAPGPGQEDGFEQKLLEDIGRTSPDRLTDADFLSPLLDRNEHDVHDADAADEQPDR